MNNIVVEKIKRIMEQENSTDANISETSATLLSGALSMALCCILSLFSQFLNEEL